MHSQTSTDTKSKRANDIKTSKPQTKKRPGRPRKKVITPPVIIHGIVDKPVNAEDVVELDYCNPMLFKKLIHLYKSFVVSEVEMKFDYDGVSIITKDHLDKSTVYTKIDGKCMNLYYCKIPIKICIKRENLDRVFGSLNKNHYKLTILLKENYRSTLYIIIKDLEYNNDDSYEVDVVFKPKTDEPEVNDDDSDYPLKFKISSKHFKTKINNIGRLSPTFTIQKYGDEPLQFTFDRAQKVNWTGVYHDASKINLKSSLDEDEIFSVSVPIDYIKPFSNSGIGDDVYISADKKKKISFATEIDKKDIGYACTVKIFTQIKEYRPQQP